MDFGKNAVSSLSPVVHSCVTVNNDHRGPGELESSVQQEQLRVYYTTLLDAWGQPYWWPARTRFEVIVGAYLTQNTAWTNVERALRQLHLRRVLNVAGIRRVPLAELEKAIHSAGYFRQKAQRLKAFVAFLDEHYAGSLSRMFAQPTEKLREELLALNGIGPETADSILLYAGQHPVFVVDAYTRRILDRHQLLPDKASYDEARALCESALNAEARLHTRAGENPDPATHTSSPHPSPALPHAPGRARPHGACHLPSPMSLAKRTPLAQIYNNMHGLIVGVGKHYCLKTRPRCDECPLQKFLPGVK